MRFSIQVPALCLVAATALFSYEPTSFVAAGKLTDSRTDIRSVVLKDGRVLIAGGRQLRSGQGEFLRSRTLSDVEILSPSWGTSRPAKNAMIEPRTGHAMTTLRDGKVLAMGGWEISYGGNKPAMPLMHNSAELFDPLTETWESVGSLTTLSGPGLESVLLKNGNVLVVGYGEAELYDPKAKAFTRVGSLLYPRSNPQLSLLPNGDVLVTGVSDYENVPAEIFRASRQDFVETGMPVALRKGAFTATALKDGRVLLAGGDIDEQGMMPSSAEIYDPVKGEFRFLCQLSSLREGHTATLLADGRVAITGGYEMIAPTVESKFHAHRSVEIISAKDETCERVAEMKESRACHGAVLTRKGNLMVFGGERRFITGSPADEFGVVLNTESLSSVEALIFK